MLLEMSSADPQGHVRKWSADVSYSEMAQAQQGATLGGCGLPSEEEGGAFKATLLWENIVTHLETSVKCGRHTQALRSFSNCFQGSKAVDCLLVHLNKTLPKTVKRPQVQTLCQKLVLTGVIEDVRDKDKDIFRENRLYRLTKNHFWASPTPKLQRKLSRTRSAEEICTEKESDIDLKGYASDSTVNQSTSRSKPSKKKKMKEKDSEAYHQRFSHSTGTKDSKGPQNPDPNLIRMKSTGFLFKSFHEEDDDNHDNGVPTSSSSTLFESKESLCLDVSKHKRKLGSSRRTGIIEPGHGMMSRVRRKSVDSGRGYRFPPPPPLPSLHTRKLSRSRASADDGSHHQKHHTKSKEKLVHKPHRLSCSLREGEKEEEEEKETKEKHLNRSYSFSSSSDCYSPKRRFSVNNHYAVGPSLNQSHHHHHHYHHDTRALGHSYNAGLGRGPQYLTGSKWIAYGFL